MILSVACKSYASVVIGRELKNFETKSLLLFRRRLLRWYQRKRRALPWRGTRDPYRIWVSEVMLQQTRVATVVEYYRRFLKHFPDIKTLAAARSEDVLRLWAGLGYYSRARNLHAAAKQVVAQHGGRFPRHYDQIRSLPGIGDYTAAAIASIAFGEPHAVLDGNVARVLARLHVIPGDLRRPKIWKELQRLSQELLHPGAPGDWNQAVMELGAVVCAPRLPECETCPVSGSCRAFREGLAEQLPGKRNKRETEEIHLSVLVCVDAKGHALLLRESNSFFSGMWQFPAVEAPQNPRKEAERLILACALRRERVKTLVALPTVRHTVTFRKLTLHPFLCRCNTASGKRVALHQIESLATSSATRKIARVAWKHLLEQGVG